MRVHSKNPFTVELPRGARTNNFLAFWVIALIALAFLLATVGILQYRWTDLASTGEEVRIGSDLGSLMMKCRGDLYGELSAICMTIQVGPDTGARDESILTGVAELLSRLQAPSASLSMASTAWKLSSLRSGPGLREENDLRRMASGSSQLSAWQFKENVPVLVHPILHHGPGETLPSPSAVDWIVTDRAGQKNWMISAFVLMLLAVNVGVLTVVGLRSHKVARLQLDFVASVSHELRTPLTAIVSASENIKDGLVTDIADCRNYGSLILSQSLQLMKSVDKILQFASIRSGKDRYSSGPVEVSKIVETVCQDTSALIKNRSCALELHIDPALPQVSGDLFTICGCLENLIANSAKYSGTDRRISLSATLRSTKSASQQVSFAVEDHGIGIKASDLDRIFEPFYRCEDANAAQIHGTGLGLSIAKHFAEVMAGSLTVVSKVGVGSTFTLHLPTISAGTTRNSNDTLLSTKVK